MRKNLLVTLGLGLVLVLAACAPQATPTSAPAISTQAPVNSNTSSSTSNNSASSSSASSSSTGSNGDTVTVADNPTLGKILVDSNGMTLYLFLKDNGAVTACTGTCAQNWPALNSASPVAGSGTDPNLLETATNNQVTYNGHLLYTFVKDKKPGDVNGEGLLSAWYAVSPSGNPVKPGSVAASPTQSSTGY